MNRALKNSIKLVGILLLASFFYVNLRAQSPDSAIKMWAYNSLNIPCELQPDAKQTVVAVIDDGFRLSHQEIKDFIFKNNAEQPGNMSDDDGNGFIDDVVGWDVADNDNNVSVPKGRIREYYHGTYVASIIAKTARLHYGDRAHEIIKILPVKALSDYAGRSYIKEGYKGVKYAMDNGADIICMAWSGGIPGAEETKIIQEAHNRGILLIGSVGNFNTEEVLFPAKMENVFAVAGLDTLGNKMSKSNYGMEVDITAPAMQVHGAHPLKDNAYIHDEGTSAAAALVTGCAAIIRSKDAELTPKDTKEILLNSSEPFSKLDYKYSGKMGAGKLRLDEAIKYFDTKGIKDGFHSPLRSKGTIIINEMTDITRTFSIEPRGGYHGFYFNPNVSGLKNIAKKHVTFYVEDTIWNTFSLTNLPNEIFIPSSNVKISTNNSRFKKDEEFRLDYYGKTINSTKLYCSETQYRYLDTGIISDGSEENNYANLCSCRWIITVTPGKRVRIEFDKLDTEGNVDFVYIVNGKTAIPENIIAKFSGQNLPPVVYSSSNEVLIWFVADDKVTGNGWQMKYEAFE